MRNVVDCRWFAGLLLVAACCGCTSYGQRVAQLQNAFYANNIEYAEKTVAESLKADRSLVEVVKLDHAIIQLASGKPRNAEKTLREVRNCFDDRENAIAKGKALSYLTDDTHRLYMGEDYEKILIRAFLALSNLMGDAGDAEAYSLQMIDKQEQIIAGGADKKGDNPKLSYQRVALAPYLRGAMREATLLNYDDAQRSYVSVVNWQPSFQAGRADLERATHGHHSLQGNGVLYVFSLTGKGPVKREVVEIPSTVSLLIASEIVSAVGRQTVPPNVAPVKVPNVFVQPSAIHSVEVVVNGRPMGITETITDVTELVTQQYKAIYPQIIARAVARRVVKMGVIYGAKEAVHMEKGSLTSLGVDLLGIAWEANEHADIRGWGLLPDKIQVLRLELPAGEHDITLNPVIGSRNDPNFAATQRVRIADSRNTYMLATFPNAKLVGKVLVSQP